MDEPFDEEVVVDDEALKKIEGLWRLRFADEDKELFVLGTAHVSEESVRDSENAVRAIQPDCLMVELCPQRVQLLMPPPPEESSEGQNNNNNNNGGSNGGGGGGGGAWAGVMRTMRERQGLSGVFQIMLQYMYKRIGMKIKVTPGAEFRAALEAVKQGHVPCQLVLGDRAIAVTIQRAWAMLPLAEKVRLLFQLVQDLFRDITAEEIESMKKAGVLEQLMMEFTKHFPSLTRVLLLERDLYLARSLYSAKGKRILAVVGLGHVKGMKEAIERWKSGAGDPEIECKDIMLIPPTPWSARRLLALLGVTSFAALVTLFFVLRFLFRLIF